MFFNACNAFLIINEIPRIKSLWISNVPNGSFKRHSRNLWLIGRKVSNHEVISLGARSDICRCYCCCKKLPLSNIPRVKGCSILDLIRKWTQSSTTWFYVANRSSCLVLKLAWCRPFPTTPRAIVNLAESNDSFAALRHGVWYRLFQCYRLSLICWKITRDIVLLMITLYSYREKTLPLQCAW